MFAHIHAVFGHHRSRITQIKTNYLSFDLIYQNLIESSQHEFIRVLGGGMKWSLQIPYSHANGVFTQGY